MEMLKVGNGHCLCNLRVIKPSVFEVSQTPPVYKEKIDSVDAALDHLVNLLDQRAEANSKGIMTNIDVACEVLLAQSTQERNSKEAREAAMVLKKLYALHNYGVTDVGYKQLVFSATEGNAKKVSFRTFDKKALMQRIGNEFSVITKCEKMIVAAVNDEVLSKTYATDPRLIRLQSENDSVSFATRGKGVREEPAPRAERPKVVVRKSVKQMADLRN